MKKIRDQYFKIVNVIDTLSDVFKKTKSDIKRLLKQNGITYFRNEKWETVDPQHHIFLQDEVIKIGKEYRKIHWEKPIKAEIYENNQNTL